MMPEGRGGLKKERCTGLGINEMGMHRRAVTCHLLALGS